jgi:hypothetical protein
MRSRSNVSSQISVGVQEARERVTAMFVSGVALVVVGLIGAAIGWPRIVIDDNGEPVHKGSAVVAVFCVGVILVGFLLALIAVVAWGVRFGMESADPPGAKDGPTARKRPAKRVWSYEQGRFTDWDDLNKSVPSQGDSPTT